MDRPGTETRVGAGVAALQIFGLLALIPLAEMFDDDPVNTLVRGSTVVVFAVVIATLLLRRSGQSWGDVGFKPPTSWARTLGAAIVAFIAVAGLITTVVQPVLTVIGAPPPELDGLADALHGNLPLLLLFLFPISWGAAAFGEELLFRGFILNRIEGAVPAGRFALPAAVLGQGVLFGLGHAYQGLTGVVLSGAVGIGFGVFYMLFKRNLWTVIIAHGLMDTGSMLALFVAGRDALGG